MLRGEAPFCALLSEAKHRHTRLTEHRHPLRDAAGPHEHTPPPSPPPRGPPDWGRRGEAGGRQAEKRGSEETVKRKEMVKQEEWRR